MTYPEAKPYDKGQVLDAARIAYHKSNRIREHAGDVLKIALQDYTDSVPGNIEKNLAAIDDYTAELIGYCEEIIKTAYIIRDMLHM